MTEDSPRNEQPNDSQNRKVPFWKVIISVIQASFGVQNSANRERDFTRGNFLHYVIAAVLFTAIFVVALIVIVKLVISQA